MNMLAKEYIERYVHPEVVNYARVVVTYALKGTQLPLKPDQPVPDNDPRNVTVYIEIDTESIPPSLIADHSCEETGLICKDHPDQPYGHHSCYGTAVPCPYPTCNDGPFAQP